MILISATATRRAASTCALTSSVRRHEERSEATRCQCAKLSSTFTFTLLAVNARFTKLASEGNVHIHAPRCQYVIVNIHGSLHSPPRFTHRLASLTASLRSPLVIETFSKDSLTGIEDFTDEGKTSSNNPPLTIEDINVVVPAEGIFLTMNALLEEGDEVVVAMPCYQVRRRCNSCSSH